MSIVKVNFDEWGAPELETISEILPGVLQDLATAARAHWVLLAQQGLQSTAQEYIRGIQMPKYSMTAATIELVGVLPNMIEQSWTGGDMRQFLLGPNAQGKKRSKEGHWYGAVPFRHSGPKSSGRAGVQMGRQYGAMGSDEQKTIGNRIYRQARKLPKTGPKRLPAGFVEKMRSHHAVDPFAGMKRQEAGGRGSTYHTFRAISTNPETKREGSWIHPGIKPGANYVSEVEAFIQRQAPAIVAAALKV